VNGDVRADVLKTQFESLITTKLFIIEDTPAKADWMAKMGFGLLKLESFFEDYLGLDSYGRPRIAV